MGALSTAGVIRTSITQSLRLYVQSKIQGEVDGLTTERAWKFRRKSFGVYLAPPDTGRTISFTKGQKTGTISGGAPDNTWIGGHGIITNNGFPLTVESLSGQVLTFAEPILATTNTSAAFSFYFDAGLFPTDCSSMKRDTVRLVGKTTLVHLSKEDFESYQGYVGVSGDYGINPPGLIHSTVIDPSIAQPVAFTSWRTATVSGVQRQVLNVYPFPDQAYALVWDGYRKPIALQITGDATGDSEVPDVPEEFHRSLLLAMVKLALTEYPGFELSTDEKATLGLQVQSNLRRMEQEQLDQTEFKDAQPDSRMVEVCDY